MIDPTTLDRDALYAARDSARGRRDVNAPGALAELHDLEREIARRRALRADDRTVAADVLARDAAAPVDELDGARYVDDPRLGPGERVDLETGAIVYSSAWLTAPEARRIIAVQASTLPEPGRDGGRNIGPLGAWERASGVRTGSRGHVGDLDATPETTGMGSRGLW